MRTKSYTLIKIPLNILLNNLFHNEIYFISSNFIRKTKSNQLNFIITYKTYYHLKKLKKSLFLKSLIAFLILVLR